MLHIAQSETRVDKIVAVVRQLITGRDDASGVVTLAASAATTTVAAPNCASGSKVFLESTTAHAAAERAAGGLYVSTVSNGSFVITHANNAQTEIGRAHV